MKILRQVMPLLIMVVVACSSQKEPTGVWVNKEKIKGKTFNKLFPVVMTSDIQARVYLEGAMAAKAASRGMAVVKSVDVIPFSLDDPKPPPIDSVMKKLKETACDAVLVSSLLNKDEGIRYTPGTSAYSVMPYYSWSGNFLGYYNQLYPTVSTSGYYSNDKEFFMQSNLYDAISQEIMWSVQSHIFNPSSLEKFSEEYVNTMVKQLEKENVITKKSP